MDDDPLPRNPRLCRRGAREAARLPRRSTRRSWATEPRRPRPRVAALALAVGLVLADSSIVVLALPEIYRDLDTSVAGVTWVLVSFNLVMALAAVPAALIARRVGPGRAAAVGLAIFAGAGLACGLSDELSTLIAARCVQALGGAAAVTAVLELLPATVGSRAARAASGPAAGATGAALGPAVGGLLTELVSWQSIFLIQVPVAIAAAVPILAVASHEAATGIIADRAAPHRPPAPARQPRPGDGLGGDRRGALPARPAADRRLAPEPDRRRDRRHA